MQGSISCLGSSMSLWVTCKVFIPRKNYPILSIPSVGFYLPLSCPLCISVVKLSLAEVLVNPALIDLPNYTLLFSLPLSLKWSTGQGVQRANTFIMLPANKIWIALQGTKLNLQFPLVDVINYWFKPRGDTAVEPAYWLCCIVLLVLCQGCLLPVPVCLSRKEWLGTIRAMERETEIRWSLFGRSMGGLFQAVFLFLDLKYLWHHCILWKGPLSEPTFPYPTHCLHSTFPAHFRGFRNDIFRCFVYHSPSA